MFALDLWFAKGLAAAVAVGLYALLLVALGLFRGRVLSRFAPEKTRQDNALIEKEPLALAVVHGANAVAVALLIGLVWG